MELERQELPNSTLILVLGILSLIGCCCFGGTGLIFGIIAVVLANKSLQLYHANPEIYIGYQNVKAGRTLGIIGIALSAVVVLAFIIALLFLGGLEGIFHAQDEFIRQYGG